MKNKNLVILSLTVAMFLSGCAYHSGIFVGNPSISISSNNFKYVKFAKGESITKKVFGIGGLSNQALVAEAKKNLLESNPLKDGQVLINITVDYKKSVKLMVTELKVTMTADVIEFK